jgi:uncharacterized protein (TIGR03435 family)
VETLYDNLKSRLLNRITRTGQVQLAPFPHIQGDRFLAGNRRLAYLIRGAFQLHESQLSRAPDWIYTERWDIEAKADVSEKISLDQMLTMLQRLLTDRFRLQTYKETRQVAVYELVVSTSGHRYVARLPESYCSISSTWNVTSGNATGETASPARKVRASS